MKVTVNIPDRVWWRATQAAEHAGASLSDAIHTTILSLAGEETTRQMRDRTRRHAVVALAEQGFTDSVICERTGETRQYVAHTRRAAGIKANRQNRTEEKKTA